MPLDPEIKVMLEQFSAVMPRFETMTPADARQASGLMRRVSDVVVAGVENRTIPGPAGDIPVRIYTPAGNKPLPVLVYYHGGGWVLGDLEGPDDSSRRLANQAACIVVSVDYRLAPEHKFPAAIDDAYAALQWVAEHARSIGGDPARIAVGGDSAGGTLAAVVSLMARDKGGPAISFQVLAYPVTNHSFDTESYSANKEGYILTKPMMIWFWNHYLRSAVDGQNAYASPLKAKDLSGLPPALVITAEYDPLRDEGEAYAARLKKAGVAVTVKRYDGAVHGIFTMAAALTVAKQAVDEAVRHLRTAFGN